MNKITKSSLAALAATVLLALAVVSACQPSGQPNSQQPLNAGQTPDTPQPPANQSPTQANQYQSQHQGFDIAARFTASGFMGDGEQGRKYVQLLEAWTTNPHSTPNCIKVVYSPGPNGWGGVYWQNKPDNWGDQPGDDFSHEGYKKLTFWARGETGNEVVEFKAGGNNKPGKQYKDSFEASTGKVQLDKDWKQYTLDLGGENLSSVIGGFCWVAAASANPKGATFYLDDILYEP
ncbi:MAG TPA: hypothetical protein VFA21_22145 [Pyrinomonadaceae bacterium]|nr:hypothetical protein [Pyrinomonadaceae bacterium]